jgi:hypothetical protein
MIQIALPVLDDTAGVYRLLADLDAQPLPYQLWICVNQPDHWWDDPALRLRAIRNQDLLAALYRHARPHIRILDYSSPGRGWPFGRGGIGWARHVLIEAIMAQAEASDWVLSIDADTRIDPTYLSAVAALQNTAWQAAVIPYWHMESSSVETTVAGSLYEIYLRLYRLQLITAGAQFCVTPLGSAFAVSVEVCRKIGGLTPKPAGEDFYFLQKIAKHTPVKPGISTVVYPEMRRSDRVLFGTGPAIMAIESGAVADYPLYPNALWADVCKTIATFPRLFEKNETTPMSAWLQKQLKTEDLWTPLRSTFKTQNRFVNACHQRVDALRIFQYLRQQWTSWTGHRRVVLRDGLPSTALAIEPKFYDKVPAEMSLSELRLLRLQLFDIEQSVYSNA